MEQSLKVFVPIFGLDFPAEQLQKLWRPLRCRLSVVVCCRMFSSVALSCGLSHYAKALPMLMPTFDREIARLAERLLIKSRPIDFRLGVFASEVIPGIPGEKPVTIKMIDAGTKEHVETIEVLLRQERVFSRAWGSTTMYAPQVKRIKMLCKGRWHEQPRSTQHDMML